MPDESWSSVKVTWLDREGVREAIRHAAQRLLAERPEVERVVLFGSLARGDAVPGSDADVLVVAPSDRPWPERSDLYAEYFRQQEVGVDVFVYTPEELAAMGQRPGIVRTALEEGIVLADRAM
jgi:predicted nucleotidyltransferase